jgi:CubicO group peptidase (beta-lactamase class C family)
VKKVKKQVRSNAGIGLLTVVFGLLSTIGQSRAAGPLEESIDDYLAPLVATNNFYGVALVARGDEILINKGYGFASIEHRVPHTAESKFQIASLSKPFTATAVLLLAERGLVDLEAPLSAVFPDYPNGDLLTIHHLLLHTSGIPDINVQSVYAQLSLQRRTPAELVAAFRDLPLAFEPGSRFSYSNSNYNLLALIIEQVTGKSYGDFLQEEIFVPLEMHNTGHRGDALAVMPHLVDGYAPIGRAELQRSPFLDWTVKTGNGSLYSTGEDLWKWARGFFGGEILSPDTMELALAEQLSNVEVGGISSNLGYVWGSAQQLGRTRFHFLGRSPGFSAALIFFPEEKLTIAVLSNTYSLVTVLAANALASMIFDEPYEQPRISSEPVPTDTVTRLVGTYKFGANAPVPNMSIKVLAQDGHLSIESDFQGFPPSALLPEADLRFILRTYWLPLTFLPDEDGNARALVLLGSEAPRVD